MAGHEIKLPPCGIFIGSGVYPMSKDYLLSTLHAHQSWMPQSFSPLQMLEKIIEDNQGNLAQFWGYARGYAPATHAEWFYALDEIGVHVPEPDWKNGKHIRLQDCEELRTHAKRRGAGILRFIKAAAERGIYTALIYTDSEEEWVRRFAEAGDYYLGYDFGERFTFSFANAVAQGKKPGEVTLKMLADDLVARVKAHVDERHAKGWGHVMATSSNFYIDYEIAAGTDIPLIEDFAFCHLNQASALSRGLYRQYNLPLWGSHLAHEHYAWLPEQSGLRMDLLRAAFQQKYMAGSKTILNESGNWFVEASLCEDSPKFAFPRVPLAPDEVSWGGNEPPKFTPYIEEARNHYGKVNYSSPWCRNYRKVISDFYDFVKANGTPEGQPESTIAIAKGNLDLCGHRFMPNYAIAGAFDLADINPQWFEGAPERGWETVREVFYPLRPVLGPYPNHFLSGTPHGMVDIVSFAQDCITAEFLNAHYKALLFAGWNTCSAKQYRILTEYVTNGGTLFIAIPHLSTNATRNYGSYGVEELVNSGDFSELCGVKVKGRGERFYWATAPDTCVAEKKQSGGAALAPTRERADVSGANAGRGGAWELGFRFPRRFGIMAVPMGDVEITDPAAQVLVVDDEQARPLLLRRALGKGTVYFLNSWAYPGALDADDGPGGRVDSKGLIGAIYRHIALRSRGTVWISDDGREPGAECEYIAYSYFPQKDRVCLQNVDFRKPHACVLHGPGGTVHIELKQGEFLMRDAGSQRE